MRLRYGAHRLLDVPIVATLLLFGIGTIISYSYALTARRDAESNYDQYAKQQSEIIAVHIESELERYNRLLLDAAGMVVLKGSINKDEWHRYAQMVNVGGDFPSLLGLGYVARTNVDGKDALEAEMLSQNLAQTHIVPEGNRDEYTAIMYLEPYNEMNKRAIGYDMFSEPVRRQAMELARDTGEATISAPVTLVQDVNNTEKKRVLLYQPIYNGPEPTTLEARRAALKGYVYIVAHVSNIASSISPATYDENDVAYSLSDAGSNTVMYSHDLSRDNHSVKTDTRNIQAFNRIWKVDITVYQTWWQQMWRLVVSLVAGMIVSALIAVAVYIFLHRMVKRLALRSERSLQRSRNDLIALASHQLRTPATGVKQYIGMLVQGYAGELSREQYEIAKKAYDTNEWQLETINRILYVAKADANQLAFRMEKFDLAQRLAEVVSEFEAQAAAKSITLSHRVPKMCMVEADKTFITMALENLISNAIKYSYTGGEVKVLIKELKRTIQVHVSDKGVGIDEPQISSLFKKFSRIDNPLSRKEGGSGLGLYLVRQIAQAHQGDIIVRSQKGEGSVFILIIPRKFHKLNHRRRKNG